MYPAGIHTWSPTTPSMCCFSTKTQTGALQELQARDLITRAVTGVSLWRTVILLVNSDAETSTQWTDRRTDICLLIRTFTQSHDSEGVKQVWSQSHILGTAEPCLCLDNKQSFLCLIFRNSFRKCPSVASDETTRTILSANSRDATKLETFQNFLASS